MKILLNSKELSAKLKAISQALPSRSVLPIIENFLFEIDGDTLSLSATNLEISMHSSIKIEGNGNGSFAVPGKLSQDILSSLPDQPITLEFSDTQMTIHASTGSYKISCMDGKDFPAMPERPAGFFTISGSVLSRGLDKVLFAASTNEDKGALCGVYFLGNGESLDMVATDAHKLQRYTAEVEAPEMNMILPLKAATIINGLVDKSDVEISIAANNAFFIINGVTISCRLLDQRYPEYNNVIPDSYTKAIEVDKRELLSALKRVKIFANKATGQLKMTCKGQSLTLECEDVDFDNRALETLTMSYDGADIEIGFNAEILFSSIAKVDSDIVRIELTEPNRAAVILPDSRDGDEDIIGLVMPIMLNSHVVA